MKQEDKELLLRDLCARLPYGVKVMKQFKSQIRTLRSVDIINYVVYFIENDVNSPFGFSIENPLKFYQQVKPYLRPISNITNKELAELCELLLDGKNTSVSSMSIYNDEIHCLVTSDIVGIEGRHSTCFSYDISLINLSLPVIDFFNSHHFDYRGLIEKDLALVASEGVYKFD